MQVNVLSQVNHSLHLQGFTKHVLHMKSIICLQASTQPPQLSLPCTVADRCSVSVQTIYKLTFSSCYMQAYSLLSICCGSSQYCYLYNYMLTAVFSFCDQASLLVTWFQVPCIYLCPIRVHAAPALNCVPLNTELISKFPWWIDQGKSTTIVDTGYTGWPTRQEFNRQWWTDLQSF